MADDKKPSGIAAALGKLRKGARSGGEAGGEAKAGKIRVKISPEHQKRASRNRWLLVSAAGIGIVFLISTLMTGGHHAAPPAPKDSGQDALDLTPAGTLRQDFETRTQAEMLHLKQQTAQMSKQQAQTANTLQKLSQSQTSLKNAIDSLKSAIKNASATSKNSASAPAPGVPPPPSQGTNMKSLPQTPPPVPGPPGSSSAPATVASNASTQPSGPMVITPPSDKNGQGEGKGKVGVHTHWQKNPMAGYIPSGSFAPAVLLTGIEAGTAQSSQSDPQPVLMRIQRRAVLPGFARYKVASCFALGSAHGSMSTERAYIRLAKLSCIDKQHHLVIDTSLKGYVADSDGMFGLRGKLVQRQGALLAKSLLAGFASGLSSALGQAQGTAYTGSFGAATTFSGTSALKGAAFGGGSKAADQLAQFYLKQAQAIFPVVEIKPRRKVTLVLTSGTSLKWKNYGALYVKKTTPEK